MQLQMLMSSATSAPPAPDPDCPAEELKYAMESLMISLGRAERALQAGKLTEAQDIFRSAAAEALEVV